MSEQKINAWKAAVVARKGAESWNNLPNGQCYQRDSFSISVGHSKAPKLTRCGQKYASGQNYWETEEAFNKTMLEWLVKNWSKAFPEIIEMMKAKERAALLECQEYVAKMQEMIDNAQED